MSINNYLDKMKGAKREDYDLTMLVNIICLRPQMYVGNRKFAEVASFIDGFAFANSTYSSEIREFSRWLGIKFRCPQNVPWFATIEQKYPDTEDALRELPKLFEEFRQTRNLSQE